MKIENISDTLEAWKSERPNDRGFIVIAVETSGSHVAKACIGIDGSQGLLTGAMKMAILHHGSQLAPILNDAVSQLQQGDTPKELYPN